MGTLDGRKGLVVGVANEDSIAYGCARAFHEAGAELAVTYLNEKAEPHVRPLAEAMGAPIVMPLDVQKPGQLEAVFERIERDWGGLDFILHSIAYAPRADLEGRLADCSAEGFATAMHISCYSFLRMAKLAEPLMRDGGVLLTVSFYGAQKVVDHYNVMGPVKAALESSVRYLSAELGPAGIRVNALSPGPVRTRAASGIKHFDELICKASCRAPKRAQISIHDVGALARFLVSDEAKMITGNVSFIDAGYHVVA